MPYHEYDTAEKMIDDMTHHITLERHLISSGVRIPEKADRSQRLVGFHCTGCEQAWAMPASHLARDLEGEYAYLLKATGRGYLFNALNELAKVPSPTRFERILLADW
jgi:hypothetical protein